MALIVRSCSLLRNAKQQVETATLAGEDHPVFAGFYCKLTPRIAPVS
jgi:hypothetical protein